ncbi:MAG TPA: hypothetical protein VK507_14485 [Iamia sp.]|nr:hypothetical protein [Iamia sp.]
MPAPVRRRHRRLGAVVVAALLLGACSSGDDGASEGDEPTAAATGDRVAVTEDDLGPFTEVDADDVAGPGTPLGGGLAVPDGALLQGAAFPDLVGGGFRALLLVTGDPVDVFDAVAGQATGLGMQGSAGCLGAETLVGCQALFVDEADGESLAVTVTRRIDPFTGVVSGVGMLYRPPGSEDGGGEGAATNEPTTPLAEVDLPDPVPVPAPEDVALAVRSPGSPMRRIEVGSELVGLPGPCACVGGGWSIVVRLEGVERDVLHGYARQFTDLGEVPDLEDRHGDDLTLIGVRVGEGDATAEIRAFLPDDGRAYAIISVRPG